MAIEDLRFPFRKNVERMIITCELKGAVIAQDDAGYYAHSFTMPDWLAAMPEKAQVEKTVVKASRRDVPKRSSGGICAQVREWTRANPEATKEDGLRQFPTVNPSTLQIQMRRARMGLV